MADALVRDETRSPFRLFGNAMDMQHRSMATNFVIENLITGITQSEFITLTAIRDRTITFGKYFECIPQKHILQGFSTTEYEQPFGYPISRRALSVSLKKLLRRGYILGLEHRTNDRWPTFYGINFMLGQKKDDLAVNCYIALAEAGSRGLRLVPSEINAEFGKEYGDWLGEQHANWLERQLRRA